MVLLYIAVFKKNTEKDFDEKDKGFRKHIVLQ